MKTTHTRNLMAAALAGALAFSTTIAHAANPATSLGAGPLASWYDGAARCFLEVAQEYN